MAQWHSLRWRLLGLPSLPILPVIDRMHKHSTGRSAYRSVEKRYDPQDQLSGIARKNKRWTNLSARQDTERTQHAECASREVMRHDIPLATLITTMPTSYGSLRR